MRLFEKYDGEISMADFTPDELAALYSAETEEQLPMNFKDKYFAKYDDIKTHTVNKKYDW